MQTGKYETSDCGTFTLVVTCFMVGVGCGAVAAMLLTPKTGSQLRRSLRRRFEDARDSVGDWAGEVAEDTQDRTSDLMDRGKEWARDLRT